MRRSKRFMAVLWAALTGLTALTAVEAATGVAATGVAATDVAVSPAARTTVQTTIPDSTSAPGVEEIFLTVQTSLSDLRAIFVSRLDSTHIVIIDGLFNDLRDIISEYRSGNPDTAREQLRILRNTVQQLVLAIHNGNIPVVFPPADSTGLPRWDPGTIGGPILPPIMPIMPPYPDSSALAEQLTELKTAVDSVSAAVSPDITVAVELLNGASDLADSAGTALTEGRLYGALRLYRQAGDHLWRAEYAISLAEELPDRVSETQRAMTMLVLMLAENPIPETDIYVDRAAVLMDSVNTQLEDGRIFRCERILHEVQQIALHINTLVWQREHLADQVQAARRVIDSLAQELNSRGIAAGIDRLNTAGSLADSADSELAEGILNRAQRFLTGIFANLGIVVDMIDRYEEAETSLSTATSVLDSLAGILLVKTVESSKNHMTRAQALADSVTNRLAAGDVYGALRAVDGLLAQLDRVKQLLELHDLLTVALPAVADQLANLTPYLEQADNEEATELYNAALAASDSAATLFAQGDLLEARIFHDRARTKGNQAIYLLMMYERTAQEIHTLQEQAVTLLQELPDDAYRERGIATRASELADSAATLLLAGNTDDALMMTQRTRRALTILVPADGQDVEIPPFILDPDGTPEELAEEMTYLAGQAWTLIAEMQTDSAAQNLMTQANSLIQQIAAALAEDNDELARALIMQAIQLVTQVVADLRNDTDLATMFFDAQTIDLINAGERAAAAAQDPTAVDEPALPAEYTLNNAPNPFNPTTSIHFALPEGARTRLAVYNMLGQEVAVLTDEFMAAGNYAITWDGRDIHGRAMSSGIYFARLESGRTSMVIRMVLAR